MSWLIPNHFPPWLGFHSDALAALVLLIISVVITFKAKINLKWHIFPIIVLFLIFVVFFQFFFGLINQPGVAWINAIYLFGLLVALLVGSLWEESATMECADFLFWTVVLGASASLGIQIYQWLELDFLNQWILQTGKSRYYANMAQPNQLGSLFFWGILGCGWIYVRGKVNAFVAIGLAAGFFFGLALTESRTGWLNGVLVAAALVAWRKLPNKKLMPQAVLMLLAFYWICVLAVPSLNAWSGRMEVPLEVRSLMDQGRLSIWSMLIKAALLNPWAGYGWGQVSHAQFEPGVVQLKIAASLQQSHNLILDLILWNGLPVGIILFIFLVWWTVRILRSINTIEQLLMVFFIAAIFVHAMLEFPLQYAYFLLPVGLMVGALNANMNLRVFWSMPKWMLWIFISMAILIISIIVKDYLKVENSFYGLRFEQRKIETEISKNPPEVIFLTQLRDYIIFARKEPAQFHSQENIEWAKDIVKTLPSAFGMYKLAAMLAFSGQAEETRYWMRTACSMHNQYQCDAVKDLWKQQGEIHPEMKKIEWQENY